MIACPPLLWGSLAFAFLGVYDTISVNEVYRVIHGCSRQIISLRCVWREMNAILVEKSIMTCMLSMLVRPFKACTAAHPHI
jgi:hypothetical protein